MKFYIDAHLDLAYNALNNQRDLSQPVSEIRAKEGENPAAGIATVSIPELKESKVGLVFGTLFVSPASRNGKNDFDGPMSYRNEEEAHQHAMAQLDYYHRLVDNDPAVRLVTDSDGLHEVVQSWSGKQDKLLGIVPLMEGADPVRVPEELEMWYERGLRIIGPAWDDTRYASGAWRDSRFGLTRVGHHLLEVMGDLGFILDLTHMSEQASIEALERYEGPIVATHSNARRLVSGERQLSDDQIRLIGERDGVIGVVLYNRFLEANWYRGAPKEHVTLAHVVSHIDHICQVLGDSDHVGIGSDFDGGIGAADVPFEINTARDIVKIADALKHRGFEENDIEKIMGRNWLSLLQRSFA